jgi:hypothetical protein
MTICKNCEHECHHTNGESCHCGCANCEHDIQDAMDKLTKVLTINEGYEYDVLFEPY